MAVIASETATIAKLGGVDASGLSINASGLGVDASGLSIDASGLSVDASGLSIDASGLSVDASGLSINASDLSDDASDLGINAQIGGYFGFKRRQVCPIWRVWYGRSAWRGRRGHLPTRRSGHCGS